jgi:hypothetical protein
MAAYMPEVTLWPVKRNGDYLQFTHGRLGFENCVPVIYNVATTRVGLCCIGRPPVTSSSASSTSSSDDEDYCGIIHGCGEHGVAGSMVTVTFDNGEPEKDLITDDDGKFCFSLLTKPTSYKYPVIAHITYTSPNSSMTSPHASTPVDLKLYPTEYMPTRNDGSNLGSLNLVAAPGYACCDACVFPVPSSVTAITKYGELSLGMISAGVGTVKYKGTITFTESNCASWGLCPNAGPETLTYPTWLATPTAANCEATIWLTCGVENEDGTGTLQWELQVGRVYVLAYFGDCPSISPYDVSHTTCMPAPLDHAPNGGAPNSFAFGRADSNGCYPLSLTFSLGVGEPNDADTIPFGTPWQSDSDTTPYGTTGFTSCVDLPEFSDTVTIL